MTYEECVDTILKLHENKPVDYWRDRSEIPLLNAKPHNNYEEFSEDAVITLPIDTRGAQSRNPFNCLVCASTGVGKTRLIKNIVKGFHKQGYKILFFEPKSVEMINARKVGTGKRLHPMDKNESLPVVSYVPNYVRSYLERNFPRVLSKVKFYSPSIETMDYVEIWQSIGLPVKTASLIVDLIHKGNKSIDYFEKFLLKQNLHFSTRQAVETTLASIRASKFFGTKKVIELSKEWEKNNIIVVNYFSRDGSMMNTDVGLVLDLIRDVSMKESEKGLQNVTKKLIIFDDAFYYAGLSATLAAKTSGGVNLAIRNISNCQNNYRTWGIDTIFVVQSPDPNAVFPSLIDGCTTKLVSYVENPMALTGKIPFTAYQMLLADKPGRSTLYIDEDNYIFQWIYVRGKTKIELGFPFDCSVGHS